jgi:hypothetical protein
MRWHVKKLSDYKTGGCLQPDWLNTTNSSSPPQALDSSKNKKVVNIQMVIFTTCNYLHLACLSLMY